jgi:uncharacterized membrane protein YozB (DUF420 family)
MTTATVCRVVGGTLVILISAALAVGGIQLSRGGPEAWPDMIAHVTTIRSTASGMIGMAAFLLAAGVATIGGVRGGRHAAAIATIVLVAAAFWVNYALYGQIRPLHTGTNVVVAAIILTLLRLGHDGRPRQTKSQSVVKASAGGPHPDR